MLLTCLCYFSSVLLLCRLLTVLLEGLLPHSNSSSKPTVPTLTLITISISIRTRISNTNSISIRNSLPQPPLEKDSSGDVLDCQCMTLKGTDSRQLFPPLQAIQSVN